MVNVNWDIRRCRRKRRRRREHVTSGAGIDARAKWQLPTEAVGEDFAILWRERYDQRVIDNLIKCWLTLVSIRECKAIKTAWKKPVFIAGFYWFFSKNFWKKPVFIGFFQNFGFFAIVCYFKMSFFLFILLYTIISYLFSFHLPYNQVRNMLIPTI